MINKSIYNAGSRFESVYFKVIPHPCSSSFRNLFKKLIGTNLTHLFKEIAHWVLRIPERATYLFSSKFEKAFTATSNFIYKTENYQINLNLHKTIASRVIKNFKMQLTENVQGIYQPRTLWNTIINEKKTLNEWEKTGDDCIIEDRLFSFHRNDLIYGFRDTYIYGTPETSSNNLRRYVYKTIKTYEEFITNGLTFDASIIGTNDIGQNPCVIYGDKKLTLQFTRHAYYLNRMNKLGILNDSMLFGELGSGAGGFAITAKRLFPNATFCCFDIPSTLLTSSYNIMMNFPDAKIGLYEDFKDKKEIFAKDLEQYDFVMLPNWFIDKIKKNTFDVFYNVESLCEMEMESIKNYLDIIEKITKKYFYTINRNIPIFVKGFYMIPLDEFPFSSNIQIINEQEDKAIDYFHQVLRNKCHYKEMLISIPAS